MKRRRRALAIVAMALLMLVGRAQAQACVPSAGTYCPGATGAAITCPSGYYCTGDINADHIACPAGTANALTGQSASAACQACAGNTVALTTGQSSCRQCPAGSTYADSATCNVCAAGSYAAQGDASCTSCSPGAASAAGASACSSCRPGSFMGAGGASACIACPTGTYTYTTGSNGAFTAVWGATSLSQCLADPIAPGAALVCLPGTRILGAVCAPCPIGYYCPQITQYPKLGGQVRACPAGTSTSTAGAIAASDCVGTTPLVPFLMEECAVAPGDVSALTALPVVAATLSLDTSIVYFTTSTAVYRLFLQSNTLELLAGVEGTTGAVVDGAVGAAALFTGSLSAVAVDLDHPEASVVVVGDGDTLRAVDVYSRVVSTLGTKGEVERIGGLALRRDGAGVRWVYASDPTNHRLVVFSVDNPSQDGTTLAGDVGGTAGYVDAYGPAALFRAPLGLAFLERSLNTSRMLLVADSGNGALRVVDTVTRSVQTWFAPLDTITPELSAPVSVAVSPQDSIVYVADKGRVVAIQMPFIATDPSVKLLTPLSLDAASTSSSLYLAALPYGSVSAGAGASVGYNELIVLDGARHSLVALVQDMLANSADGGGGVSTCHLPCQVAGCGALSSAALCGNSFLDAGEQCDNPSADWTGCHQENCTRVTPGFACPGGASACLQPCVGYVYAPTGVSYCSADCAALTPPAGYTVDDKCVVSDIDECVANTDTCDKVSAMCINTAGSYQCQCLAGFFGDGHTCQPLAYAVYTVVDVPAIQSSTIVAGGSITEALMTSLVAAYATDLAAGIPAGNLVSGTFPTANAAQLAGQFASYSLDPTFASTYARLELVTLFETNALANTVAAAVNPAALTAALSQALFGVNTGVTVVQSAKTRAHSATSFLQPTIQGGWGMNITSVVYNRSCTLQNPAISGFTVAPPGGCWQVEMVYMGGQELPHSDESPNLIQQSQNVLYLPRIERNTDTLAALVPAQTLTMSSGAYFPCTVTGASAGGQGGIAPSATACCLRPFEHGYRPSRDFLLDFLGTPAFDAAVPSQVCSSGLALNGTFPSSDIVFKLPSTNGATTNDYVVGAIEGMPSSEVRLLETIDYTQRMFRVLLVLEEGDLRTHASMTRGITGLDYNMTFFVGLANFQGTGTSVLNTRNAQQYITVSKTNELTISTFGTNQDPLFSSETMQLTRIKVSDFFNPVQYLYYLQVTFTLPSNFQAPQGAAIVPLNGIRLIKVAGGMAVSATSPDWMQVCAGASGNYVYANTSLQALVSRAQSQACVQSDLAMCNPPASTTGVVSFGLPVPIGFLTDADFAGFATGNPTTLNVELVVQSYDNTARTNILSSLSMAVQLSPLGYTAMCETMSASQTLADIIDGSIYVGTATNDAEWATTMQKQSQIQVPGTTPAKSLEFSTTTVQGSMMTFAALGDPTYFEDARYQGQNVHMHNIFSIHFLEPLGGAPDGATPNFDAVKALFFAGKAFNTITDAATHNMWLVPSQALLSICPQRPTVGKLACLTRIDSTDANNVLVRSANDIIELQVDDGGVSRAQMQNLMAQMINQGGVTDFSQNLGGSFYDELKTKLNLNNRYRKAYVVNPVMDWSTQAIQSTQPGASAYTVATKIIAIGLITLRANDGTQLARRLLSVGLEPHEVEASFASLEKEQRRQQLMMQEAQVVGVQGQEESSFTVPMVPLSPEQQAEWEAIAYDNDGSSSSSNSTNRRLLQTTSFAGVSLSPSKASTANSMTVNINAPGYDAVTQLCPVLGATTATCRMLAYTIQVSGEDAQGICNAHAQGSLSTLLNDGFAANLLPAANYPSNVTGTLLTDLGVSGCPSSSSISGARRLLQLKDVVIVISRVLLSVTNSGSTIIDPARLAYIQFFQNATIMQQLLGGGAVIITKPSSPPLIPVPGGNGQMMTAPVGESFLFFLGGAMMRMTNVWAQATPSMATCPSSCRISPPSTRRRSAASSARTTRSRPAPSRLLMSCRIRP